MVFSDTLNKQGICEEIDFFVNSDNNSYPLADKCRNVNRAYDRVVSLILECDGRWEFDDINATNFPIAVTDMVAGQQDYSFDSSFLVISRVEVQMADGSWRPLQPFSQENVTKDGVSLTDFMKGGGDPKYYDKVANSMFLYPAPSNSITGGIKVYFQRNVSYFVPTDTTKSPGFASPFHRILSMSASLDYARAKNLDIGLPHGKIPNSFVSELEKTWEDMKDFYSRRSKDENIGLKTRKWKFQ